MSAKGKWDNVIQYCVLMNVIAVGCALLMLYPPYGGPLAVTDSTAQSLIALMAIATLMGLFALPPAVTHLIRPGHRLVGLSELLLAVLPLFVCVGFYFIIANRGVIDK